MLGADASFAAFKARCAEKLGIESSDGHDINLLMDSKAGRVEIDALEEISTDDLLIVVPTGKYPSPPPRSLKAAQTSAEGAAASEWHHDSQPSLRRREMQPPPPVTAPGAHDAGIDYGVLAPDIAADNMAAHIAAKADQEMWSSARSGGMPSHPPAPAPASSKRAVDHSPVMNVIPGPGPRYMPADDKQRAFDAWVDPGMRDALRQRARKLLDANPCFLRALQMVEISTVDPERKTEIRLWIHVVLQPDKQRVSYHVLKALQGSDFGREEWCLPNKSLLRNNGIEHNVECFRHVMSQAGPDDYEEIPGCLEPRPKILRNGSAEANQMMMTFTESDMSTDDLLELDFDQIWSIWERLLTPDDEGSYRSLSAVDQAPTSRGQAREEFAARLARVRAELAQYRETLRALDEE